MRVFNVEIFTRDFEITYHSNVSDFPISEDYLAPQLNTIYLLAGDISVGEYIWISSRDLSQSFFGVISAVEDAGKGRVSVNFASFIESVFNVDILFDTDLQGDGTFEVALHDIISDYWMTNSDSAQNVFGLSPVIVSDTYDWGLNLKSDVEGQHHLICNFFNTFILRGMEKYQVRLKAWPDLQAKIITLAIGKNSANKFTIEADLPNVVKKSVIIKQTDNTVNKLEVWDEDGYLRSITYYMHSDGSYDMIDADRITPVVFETRSASEEQSSFEKQADAIAAEVFGAVAYNNCIELEVLEDDSLTRAASIEIGQECDIISDGKIYPSILTGKTYSGGKITLLFGTVRVDLTKMLKREAR